MAKKLPVHYGQNTINSENDEEIVDKVVNLLNKIKENGEFIPKSEVYLRNNIKFALCYKFFIALGKTVESYGLGT